MADSGEHTIGLDETEAVAEVEEAVAEADVTDKEEKKPSSRVTVDMRYYYLHREERKKKQLERYHNDPVVIAKREEKARKRAEKGVVMTAAEKAAQKEARRIEREKIIQERTAKALETRRKMKPKTDGGLTEFLSGASPSSSGLSDN